VRSRILDHFWVGRPSVVSADDAAADLIKEHQAGEVVPIGDSQTVGAVLIRLLTDHQHWIQQSANAAALGQGMRWSEVVSSLLRLLKDAHPKERLSMPVPDGSRLATLQRVRNDAIRVQEQLWQIEPLVSTNPFLRFVQRIILRLFANPQREYNAAALRSMYALAEQIDQLTRQMQELSQRSDMLELRVTNLESGLQDHNHRQVQEIHQIGQQIRDFADQIAGLEETTSQILAHIGGVHTPPFKQKE